MIAQYLNRGLNRLNDYADVIEQSVKSHNQRQSAIQTVIMQELNEALAA